VAATNMNVSNYMGQRETFLGWFKLEAVINNTNYIYKILTTVKPVLNGISRVQNIFPLKPGFCLIKVYYDSHGIWKHFRLSQNFI
jgi:hypothetical protein